MGGVVKDRIKNKKYKRKCIKKHPKPRRLQKYLTRKQMDNKLWKGKGIHINKLKPPPIYRKRFKYHFIKDVFISVKRSHLANHNKIGS